LNKNLFIEICKIKRVVRLVSIPIDRQQGDASLAQYSFDKYKQLFKLANSYTNSNECCTLLTVINNRIIHGNVYVISDVSPIEVTRAVNQLKLNKHDGIFVFSSSGFKKGAVALFNCTSMLFTVFCTYWPSKIIMYARVSMVNDTRDDICSSENYRTLIFLTVLIKNIFEYHSSS